MTFYRKWGAEMLEELPSVLQLLKVHLLSQRVCCTLLCSESVFPIREGEAVEVTLP